MGNYIEYLKRAILDSYTEFKDNGFKNMGDLEAWMSIGVFDLYSKGIAHKFANEHINFLEENLNKNDVLEFIVNSYVQEIEEKPEDELVDTFQKTVRKTDEQKGSEEVIAAIQKFIKENDFSMFVECDEEDLKKYNQAGLVKIMCASTVKRVIEHPIIDFSNLKPSDNENKTFFTEAELAVVANSRENDIDKVVGAMEAIRSGKISNKTLESKEAVGRE